MSGIRVKHSLPHRVRFRMSSVRHNETAARSLEKRAEGMDGILWVRANTKCAGVVVRFDPRVYSENEIIDIFSRPAVQGAF